MPLPLARRLLDATRALAARYPEAATVVLGASCLLVSGLGLACLVTGLREPTTDHGIALVVLGLVALISVCAILDAGVPVGRG